MNHKNKKVKKEELKKISEKQSGITLIALIITIVILIILATVAINFVFNDGLIKRAEQAKNMAEESSANEIAALDYLSEWMGDSLQGIEGYSIEDGVNIPKLAEGMIPVYYDEEAKVWKVADENNENKEWYNYEEKRWANIVTVREENAELREAEAGTEIPMEDITTFFVWIPRYAYSITSGYREGNGAEGKIDVTFLKGNTNIGSDNVEYETDYDESTLNPGDETPKIVHSGFRMGNKELNGIWVAKFEASGTNAEGVAVGNRSASSSTAAKADGSTYVKIVPSVPSWREITIGESEYRSMEMSSNTANYGWTSEVNSHLMKNSEWGAVAYLCYSEYGSVPKTNGSGTYSGSYYYDMYTGAGVKGKTIENGVEKFDEGRYETFTEETYGYNTELGEYASTTGNVYGVYDMAGGAWERVAAYLDNKNSYLNTYGKSSSNTSITYFENGELKSEYAALWDAYEVSEEEKSNQIMVAGEAKTQSEIWNWNYKSIDYNEARQRITEVTFNNMAQHKGIGVNETTSTFSYYAPYGTTSGKRDWFQTVKDTETNTTTEYGRTWDRDYILKVLAINCKKMDFFKNTCQLFTNMLK